MSESNIFSSAGLNVCPRHIKYIIFLYLEIMPRVSTTLHLSVGYIDDITRSIIICNNTYKFADTHIVFIGIYS